MSNSKKYSAEFLMSESFSLITRIEQMKPFEMTMPMVKSASVSVDALRLIGELLDKGKANLRKGINQFISYLNSNKGDESTIEDLQNRFTVLKLRYNQILDQLDIFADVLSQRSEHLVGTWLSGLDALAEDGLKVGEAYYDAPSLMVFLDRGHGAAIRRARTRLPGGDVNPVAVIQIPRERMVGNSIASSLIHEVGHQGAALLNLITSLKLSIQGAKHMAGKNQVVWSYFERWISEIIADFWAIAQLGVSATMGLMGVLTLPGYFQFRLDLNDPHPAPYIRVQLSCRIGKMLFPDPQWNRLWNLWESFYPKEKLQTDKLILLQQMDEEMDNFINLMIYHKPISLKGKQLIELFKISYYQPNQLREEYNSWKRNPNLIQETTPIKVFAVLGQARADQVITSNEESKLLKDVLDLWAINR